ncbi:Hydrophobin 2 [Mycena venus]|uniref:Hydrophobin n=1 Tax=Mycena venus TaxID=2733690 RepID=A0A8H7CFP3_9AGAR|nr:Hydrophobin 2 [Mycena venus]
MFSKLSVVVASALITLAAATPTTVPVTPPTSDQCCQTVVDSSSTAAGKVLSLLGIDLGIITIPVGLNCSPLTVLGNNCGDITTRCDAPEIEWGGLIAINCIPITIPI